MIAVVVMAETLLSENNFAAKMVTKLMIIKKFWPVQQEILSLRLQAAAR